DDAAQHGPGEGYPAYGKYDPSEAIVSHKPLDSLPVSAGERMLIDPLMEHGLRQPAGRLVGRVETVFVQSRPDCVPDDGKAVAERRRRSGHGHSGSASAGQGSCRDARQDAVYLP